MRKVPLGGAHTGATSAIWGRQFTVLEQYDQNSLVVLKKELGRRPAWDAYEYISKLIHRVKLIADHERLHP